MIRSTIFCLFILFLLPRPVRNIACGNIFSNSYNWQWLSRRVRIKALCQKTKQNFRSDLEHLPIFKALCESNPEQLLVFKAPRGDAPRVEHVPLVDDQRVQSGTTPRFYGSTSRSTSQILNNSLFVRIHAGTIHESNTSHAWTIHESGTIPCF